MLDIPHVSDEDKLESLTLPNNFYRLIIKFGFKDEPDIPQALELAATKFGLPLEPMQISYFIGRQTLIREYRQKCLCGGRSFSLQCTAMQAV